MKEDLKGIQRADMKKLVQNLSTNLEKLLERFEQLDIIIDGIPKNYQARSSDMFQQEYDKLHCNYDTVKKNFLSYVQDLENVSLSYTNFEMDMAEYFHSLDTKEHIEKYERRT